MAETKELLAAEEEFQARKRSASDADDGWEAAQPDAGLPRRASPSIDAKSRDAMDVDTVPAESAGAADVGPAKKKLKMNEADRKRGNRMFGAMMGTLSKFKDETSKTRSTEAAKRRQEVEQRLQNKLKNESEVLLKKREREHEEKQLRQLVVRKTEEIGSVQQTFSARHSAKLNLANFLCTSFPPQAKTDDPYHAASVLPTHPHCLPVGSFARNRDAPRPVYWMPYRLLPAQRELISKQKREVREEVDSQRSEWAEEKASKEESLAADRAHRDARLREIAAEQEEFLPRPRRASPDVQRPSVVEDSPAAVGWKAEDVKEEEDMDGDGVPAADRRGMKMWWSIRLDFCESGESNDLDGCAVSAKDAA